MPELNYLYTKNYGREELLLHTANRTVEERAKRVSALYSHLALSPL